MLTRCKPSGRQVLARCSPEATPAGLTAEPQRSFGSRRSLTAAQIRGTTALLRPEARGSAPALGLLVFNNMPFVSTLRWATPAALGGGCRRGPVHQRALELEPISAGYIPQLAVVSRRRRLALVVRVVRLEPRPGRERALDRGPARVEGRAGKAAPWCWPC